MKSKPQNIDGLYSMKDLSVKCKVCINTIRYRIKELNLKPLKTVSGINYFNYSDYLDIKQFHFSFRVKTEVEIIHHTEIYYIRDSKMNYLEINTDDMVVY